MRKKQIAITMLFTIVLGTFFFPIQGVTKTIAKQTVTFRAYFYDENAAPATNLLLTTNVRTGTLTTTGYDGVVSYKQNPPTTLISGRIIPHAGGGQYFNNYTSTQNLTWGREGTTTSYIYSGLDYSDLEVSNVPAYIKYLSTKNPINSIEYNNYTEYGGGNSGTNTGPNIWNNRVITADHRTLSRTGVGTFSLDSINGFNSKYDYPGNIMFAHTHGYSSMSADTVRHNIGTTVNGVNGGIRYYFYPFEVIENFVDQNGATITPPSGYTQGKLTDADADQFTHTMSGTLPTSYQTGGKTYVLKGSYNGPTKPGILDQTNPPTITVDYTQNKTEAQFDAEGQITVVYAEAQNVTEKYIDESGTQIDATWDPAAPQVVERGESFTIPHAAGDIKTDSGGTDWEYIGWKYSSDGSNVVNTTPTAGPINSDVTVQYIYRQSKTTATLNLTPVPQIVPNSGDTVSWTSRLTNTGSSDLKDMVLKQTGNWSAGLSEPVQVTVTPAIGAPINFTVNAGDLATGVNLTGVTIPHTTNNYADITFSTVATGNPNQVLLAEIEVDGNLTAPVKADNYVRMDDGDEPYITPTGPVGFTNIPKYEFGTVEVSPFSATHALDTTQYTANTQSNGLYVRFFDEDAANPNWTLSAKLDSFTSGSNTLANTTKLVMNNAELGSIQNVNTPNEGITYSGAPFSLSILADGVSASVPTPIGSGTSGHYQLRLPFNDVALQLAGNQGIAGQSYQSDLTWTLTTAP